MYQKNLLDTNACLLFYNFKISVKRVFPPQRFVYTCIHLFSLAHEYISSVDKVITIDIYYNKYSKNNGCKLTIISMTRSPHCRADTNPCVQRLSQFFLAPFQYRVVMCNIFLLDFWTSE